MRLFGTENRNRTAETRRVYALFEIAYTCIDFAAALLFITGSILFLTEHPAAGRWLFLGGSILFAGKPTLRLVREVKLYWMGYHDFLARRVEQ